MKLKEGKGRIRGPRGEKQEGEEARERQRKRRQEREKGRGKKMRPKGGVAAGEREGGRGRESVIRCGPRRNTINLGKREMDTVFFLEGGGSSA